MDDDNTPVRDDGNNTTPVLESTVTSENATETISTSEVDISQERSSDTSEAKSFIISSSINNGSFEGSFFEPGTFQNWRTIGDTSIETEEIGIAPTDGESQALITNGFSDSGGSVEESDLSEFLDLPSGSLDTLLNGDATEGSGIKQTFNAQAGDILEFDYSFLTNEGTPSATFNDSAFFSLAGFTLELADTSDPTFSDKSVEGFSEATDSKNIKIAISQAGSYDLGFGVVDLSDTIVDSGLLLDDVKLTSTGAGSFSIESLAVEGADSAMSSEADFTFGPGGFEAVNSTSESTR